MLSTPPRPHLRRAHTDTHAAPASPLEHSHARAGFKSGWLDSYDPLATSAEPDALDYFSLPRAVAIEGEQEHVSSARAGGPLSVRASEPLHQLLLRSGKFAQLSHSLPSSPVGGRRRPPPPSPPSAWHGDQLADAFHAHPLRRVQTLPDVTTPPDAQIKVKVLARATGDIYAFRSPVQTTLSALSARARVGPREALFVAAGPPGSWDAWDADAIADDEQLSARLRSAGATLRLVAAAPSM